MMMMMGGIWVYVTCWCCGDAPESCVPVCRTVGAAAATTWLRCVPLDDALSGESVFGGEMIHFGDTMLQREELVVGGSAKLRLEALEV